MPECYIFDIDSTLALRNGRSPYDWNSVDTDVTNTPIVEIFQALRDYKKEAYFFLLTGRDEYCRDKTEKWLKDNGIVYHELFMRPAGSKELDTAVKVSMYNTHIKDKYKVVAVFEDRGRCVDLFRTHLGLTVLDVAGGKY